MLGYVCLTRNVGVCVFAEGATGPIFKSNHKNSGLRREKQLANDLVSRMPSLQRDN